MPPASPPTTLVERMASSSEVLPWSTWPMMVTTGGRGTSVAGSSAASNRPSSTSDSATRLHRVAEFLGDELGGVGVDRVGDLQHLALLHQQLDHVRAALGHAVGELLDGDGLRNGDLADELFLRLVGGDDPCSRWMRRRNEATERSRSSSAVSAVTSVSRPRRFSTPARAGFGAGAGRAAPPAPRRGRGASSSSASSAGARRAAIGPVSRGLASSSSPKRFLAPPSALCLVSSVVLAALLFVGLAGLGGLAFGALDLVALLADPRFLFGDLALFGLAQPGVAERVRAGGALFLGQRAQHDAGRLGGRASPGPAPARPPGPRSRPCRRRDACAPAPTGAGAALGPCRARGSSPSRPRPPWCGRG